MMEEVEDNKGNPTEHLSVGISLFMAQCEDKVRQKNAIIAKLEAEREQGWERYYEDRLQNMLYLAYRRWKKYRDWMMAFSFALGGCLCGTLISLWGHYHGH
jgi:hypothetical protein